MADCSGNAPLPAALNRGSKSYDDFKMRRSGRLTGRRNRVPVVDHQRSMSLQTKALSERPWIRFVPRRLLVALRNDRFQRDIVQLGGGTALGQLLVVAATPLLTRLYSPTDFALAGLLIAFVAFAGVATGLRYDLAIVDAKTEREAHILLFGAMLSAIPVSLLSALIYLWMIHHRVLTYEQLGPWTSSLVFAVLLLAGLFTSCRLWYARAANFRTVSRALVLQGTGRAALPLLLFPLHLGWAGLISGEVAGRALGVSRMIAHAVVTLRVHLAEVTAAEIRKTLSGNWRYPLIMVPSSLIDALQAFLPLPVISVLFGPLAAGEFVLVTRVSGLPMGLVAASVSDVYHSRIADTLRNSPGDVEQVFKEVALYLARIAAVAYVPVILLSPFLFGVVFGANWQQAGVLNAIIGPAMAIQLVSSPLTRTLNVLGYQLWKITFDVPRVCVPLSGIWLGHHLGLNFEYSIGLFAAGSFCVEAALLAIIWRATRSVKP
jgi:lipopolysaccharide exporter